MNITNHKNCCGCAACADACPKNCIEMVYDEHGFYHPKIDSDTCINCKNCIKICPANHEVKKEKILSVFKGYVKDIANEVNQKSTSGAIFGALSEQIIKNNGKVIGVAFDEGFENVSHIVCSKMSEVDKCRGSKYIQSKTQGIYKKAGEILKSNKTVLFTGTPCQVSALKSFLKKPHDNLITVDFVCHGVASTYFYQEYIKFVSNGNKINHVGFRDKCGYYLNSRFRLTTDDKNTVVNYPLHSEGLGKAFANNLISRQSCGGCKYASPERVSDISLADNILFTSDKEKEFGSSLIFLNTEKGVRFFDSIKDSLVIEELKKEYVLPKIMHFNNPAMPHKDRDKLLKVLAKKGYLEASKLISDYHPKTSPFKHIAFLFKRVLRKCARITNR